MAAVLHKMFREQEVIKKYWAITKGVPNPDIGMYFTSKTSDYLRSQDKLILIFMEFLITF